LARPVTELERARRSAGFSLTAFATAIGFDKGYCSRIEGGTEQPSARFRASALAVLGPHLGEIIWPDYTDKITKGEG